MALWNDRRTPPSQLNDQQGGVHYIDYARGSDDPNSESVGLGAKAIQPKPAAPSGSKMLRAKPRGKKAFPSK